MRLASPLRATTRERGDWRDKACRHGYGDSERLQATQRGLSSSSNAAQRPNGPPARLATEEQPFMASTIRRRLGADSAAAPTWRPLDAGPGRDFRFRHVVTRCRGSRGLRGPPRFPCTVPPQLGSRSGSPRRCQLASRPHAAHVDTTRPWRRGRRQDRQATATDRTGTPRGRLVAGGFTRLRMQRARTNPLVRLAEAGRCLVAAGKAAPWAPARGQAPG